MSNTEAAKDPAAPAASGLCIAAANANDDLLAHPAQRLLERLSLPPRSLQVLQSTVDSAYYGYLAKRLRPPPGSIWYLPILDAKGDLRGYGSLKAAGQRLHFTTFLGPAMHPRGRNLGQPFGFRGLMVTPDNKANGGISVKWIHARTRARPAEKLLVLIPLNQAKAA